MSILVHITTNHFYNEYIILSSLEEISFGNSFHFVSEFVHSGPKRGLLCRTSEYDLLLWK